MSQIIDGIKKRVTQHNNSFQCMVVGAPGTGKSLVALSMCKKIDPNFNANRVVFTPEDFMELVQQDLEPGSAIMCDEAGMWFSNRDWNSVGNKIISTVLETYRYKNLVVFWTFPVLRMTDLNLRDLAHAVIETVQIDRQNEVTECKFKKIMINSITGKKLEKFPTKTLESGERVKITRIRVKRPSRQLEKSYEDKKIEVLTNKYNSLKDKLQFTNNKGNRLIKEKKTPNIKCHKCGNTWFTKSKSKRVSCTSCGVKTTTRL